MFYPSTSLLTSLKCRQIASDMYRVIFTNLFFKFFLGDIPANRALVKDNSVLSLRNVIPEDQDTYVCRADNPAGSAQVKASVQVHCKFKVYR